MFPAGILIKHYKSNWRTDIASENLVILAGSSTAVSSCCCQDKAISCQELQSVPSMIQILQMLE